MTWHVDFVDVGRGKKRWRESWRERPTEQQIAKTAKKNAQLMSAGVDAMFDDDLEHGVILVGGFREVGAFRLTSTESMEEAK